MKLNVKGLVFVGFAAAVFANAASAAGTTPAEGTEGKTVTSYKFTEATYQKKLTPGTNIAINGDNVISTSGEANVIEGVTVNGSATTVTNKIADVQAVTGVNKSDGTPLTVSNGVVTLPAATAPGDGTLSIQVGSNAAQTFTANQATGTNTTVNLGAAAGLGTATTISSTSTNADAATAKAVYDYVDALDTEAYTGNGLIDVTDHVITTTAEVNTINTVKVNGTALTPDADRAVNVVVPAAGDGQLSIQVGSNAAQTFTANQATGTNTTVNLGAAAGLGTATTISSTSTNADAATAKAVYDYMQAYAPTIEAIPSTCTAQAPCALVAAGNGAKWEPIQQ